MTSKKIEDGGPAFPVEVQTMPDGSLRPVQTGHMTGWSGGLTTRDYFAIHADVPWNAVIDTLAIRGESSRTVQRMAEYLAEVRYIMADAMIAARKAGEA